MKDPKQGRGQSRGKSRMCSIQKSRSWGAEHVLSVYKALGVIPNTP